VQDFLHRAIATTYQFQARAQLDYFQEQVQLVYYFQEQVQLVVV
jgi:hypothetical protein